MSIKALLTRIITVIYGVLPSTGTIHVDYTTGTANTWVKTATINIPKEGLYRMYAPYYNSSVYGIGWSGTSATSVSPVHIILENSTGAMADAVAFLPAGEISIWTKCAAASRTNYFEITPILIK